MKSIKNKIKDMIKQVFLNFLMIISLKRDLEKNNKKEFLDLLIQKLFAKTLEKLKDFSKYFYHQKEI